MTKFKDFVEKNSQIGEFTPHPDIAVDTIAGNYMKGRHGPHEFEVFVHRTSVGRGIQNGRVWKLRLMDPKVDHASPDEEGWSQNALCTYDRGWIQKAETPETEEAVRAIISMFPGDGSPMDQIPTSVPTGGKNIKAGEAAAIGEDRDEYWKELLGEVQEQDDNGGGEETSDAEGEKKKIKDKDWKKKLYGADIEVKEDALDEGKWTLKGRHGKQWTVEAKTQKEAEDKLESKVGSAMFMTVMKQGGKLKKG